MIDKYLFLELMSMILLRLII